MLVWSLFVLYMIFSQCWCPYDSLLMSPLTHLASNFWFYIFLIEFLPRLFHPHRESFVIVRKKIEIFKSVCFQWCETSGKVVKKMSDVFVCMHLCTHSRYLFFVVLTITFFGCPKRIVKMLSNGHHFVTSDLWLLYGIEKLPTYKLSFGYFQRYPLDAFKTCV